MECQCGLNTSHPVYTTPHGWICPGCGKLNEYGTWEDFPELEIGVKKIKIYVSHSIRGKFGANATKEQMVENCEKAIKFGNWLRKNFPNVEWYIPADHDEFVATAYLKGFLSEERILDIDCELLRNRNGLLVHSPDNYISRGMRIEIDFADENSIPTFFELSTYLYSNSDLPTEGGRQKIEHFIKELENGS